MDDTSLISETDSGIEINISNGIGTPNNNILYIRFSVPVVDIEKCLQLNVNDSAWIAKQHLLTSLNQDLPESFNYGLFCPPANGRAGKFLDEERPLKDYPFSGPVGFIEFKYKQRLYKNVFSERQLKQIHLKSSVRMLIDAVRKNDVDRVTKLTRKGFDANFIDPESGETPITLAVELSNPKQMMLALVEGGCHLDFRNARGRTSVHRAGELGNSAALQVLLDFGMSTNYKDAEGLTPLYVCVMNGCDSTSERCVEILLYDHAMLGMTDRVGCTELHQACKTGRPRIIDQLIYYGADVNCRNYIGNTPLHMCAVFDQVECARLLMFRGADRYAKNSAGETAYHLAKNIGNLQLASTIEHFSQNEVVLYRDLPVYNEKRRSLWLPSAIKPLHSADSRSNSISGSSTTIRRNSRQEVARCSSGSQHQLDGAESVKSLMTAPSNWSLAESETGSRKETNLCNTRQRSVVLQTTEGDSDFGFILKAVDACLVDACPSQHQFAGIHEPSPAQRAGLQAGEFLIEVNGVNVTSSSPDDVIDLISTFDTVITMSVSSHVTAMPNNNQENLKSLTAPTVTAVSTHNLDPTRFIASQVPTSFGTTRKPAFMSMSMSTTPPEVTDDMGHSASNKVASIRSVHGKRMTTSIPLEELFASMRNHSTNGASNVLTLRSLQARHALGVIHCSHDDNVDLEPSKSTAVCGEAASRLHRSTLADGVLKPEYCPEPEIVFTPTKACSDDTVSTIGNGICKVERLISENESSQETVGELLSSDASRFHQPAMHVPLDENPYNLTPTDRLGLQQPPPPPQPPPLPPPLPPVGHEGRRTLSASERLQCRPLPPQRRPKSKVLDRHAAKQNIVDRELLHLATVESILRHSSSMFSDSDKAALGGAGNVVSPSLLTSAQKTTALRHGIADSAAPNEVVRSGVVEAAVQQTASHTMRTTKNFGADDGRCSRVLVSSDSIANKSHDYDGNGWRNDENKFEARRRGTTEVDGTPDVVKHRSMRTWHQQGFTDSRCMHTTNGLASDEYQNLLMESSVRRVGEMSAESITRRNLTGRVPAEMNYGYFAPAVNNTPPSHVCSFDANLPDEDDWPSIIPPPVGFHDNDFPPPPPEAQSSDRSWLPQPPYLNGFAVNHHKTLPDRNLMTKIATMEGFRI